MSARTEPTLTPKLKKQINRHFGKSNKQKLKDAVKRAGK